MNETIEIIKQRRSVRSYSNKPIPKKILEELIDCARFAPSAKNIQPWEFVVITDKKTLNKIASFVVYGSFIRDAAACIIVLCQDTTFYVEDGSAASENILIAAQSLGIGSCWVAGDKKEYSDTILKLVNAPGNFKVVSIIALGYSNEKVAPKAKREVNDILHWEHF